MADNHINGSPTVLEEKGRLCEAAAFGDIKTIKYLVKKQGLDVNSTPDDITGSTPLIWSIINSKVKVAKLLIRMGADIHGTEFNKKTAFEWAEASSNSKILSLLRGTNHQNKKSSSLRIIPNLLRKLVAGMSSNQNLKSIKDECDTLHDAAIQKNSQPLKTLINNNKDGRNIDINTKNKKGDTPLHAAIKHKRSSTAKFLLSSGADTSIKDDEGKSPLYLIFANNENRKCDDILRNMIMRGANIFEVEDPSSESGKEKGKNILELAYAEGDLRTVKIICKSLPPNSPYVLHAFEQAIINGSVVILKMLLKRWPRGVKDSNGNSILHIAIQKKNYEIVSDIIETFDVNQTNNDGDTPLHLAVTKKQNEIVCLLLHNNADVNIQNHQGDTPLHLAVQSNLLIFILLVDKCRNSLQNHDGDTAFHLAARYGKTDLLDLMIRENKPSSDPYSSNHDVSKTSRFKNVVNKQNCTALHYACFENNYKIVEKLLEIDVDSEIKNNEGKTALDIAIAMNHFSLVSLFKGSKLSGNSLASFLCKVCIELPLAPSSIYKCANGHNYCSSCDEHLTILQCPECGIPIRKKLRNKDAEEKLLVMFPDADMQAHIDSFECLFEYDEN